MRGQVTWHAPPKEWTKCNIDAAFTGNSERNAVAVVVRNHEGMLIAGTTSIITVHSSLAAEAIAMAKALPECEIATNCKVRARLGLITSTDPRNNSIHNNGRNTPIRGYRTNAASITNQHHRQQEQLTILAETSHRNELRCIDYPGRTMHQVDTRIDTSRFWSSVPRAASSMAPATTN
ncbi:hypothetical protein PIB30_053246 [Stylosanthes scabra]|uniref:RNase H type-1 domain-containing protein n=1 Tax=Stylosanthes scabra TaxID=79078 RepID=A0ABU6XJB5_9FABA|nr:hypothetical protein [Stylosanthes scabra]